MELFLQTSLKYLERITQVNLRYFLRGGAWLTGSQLALSAMALLSAIAFANLLPEDVFGQYRFILSVVGILSISTLSGMNTAFMRSASRGFEQTIYIILKRKITFALLGSLGAAIVAIYYIMNDNYLLAGAVAISIPFIPLKNPLKIYDVLLQARRKFSAVALYRIITQGISLFSLVITIYLSNNLYLLLLAYFLPVTLCEALILFYTTRKSSILGGVDTSALRYGYHLSFLRGISGLAGNIQNIMLFHFLGPVSVATFYFALAPVEQVRAFLRHIETLLFPKTAQDTWHIGPFRLFVRKVSPFLFVIMLGVAGYIILAPTLFSLVFPVYQDAVYFSQLLAPTLLLTAINTVLFAVIRSKGSVKTQYVLRIVEIFLQFVVTVPAIYFFGIIGLVGAIAINKSVTMILLIVRSFVYPHPYFKQFLK